MHCIEPVPVAILVQFDPKILMLSTISGLCVLFQSSPWITRRLEIRVDKKQNRTLQQVQLRCVLSAKTNQKIQKCT
jgi:hypothetical protein